MPDIMVIPEDWKEFLSLLNAREVEYLVVGAHALAYHGLPRFTGDLDRPGDEGERIPLAAR